MTFAKGGIEGLPMTKGRKNLKPALFHTSCRMQPANDKTTLNDPCFGFHETLKHYKPENIESLVLQASNAQLRNSNSIRTGLDAVI